MRDKQNMETKKTSPEAPDVLDPPKMVPKLS